ncbi:Prefoldin subunit 6 [Recurvomyces mirabilis]|uniref:Prefoldin subunit 6 n=1 Tax=Recurvomyces mirabilis TaxID=574656 RepID=A0AAE0WSQ1_9PEZI|nr:Prefoldin subunit 6 [Recurvomyces mirabilis]KAK5159354.1 Prefoldin subunit 6 [Recurvomyces mirabilis]
MDQQKQLQALSDQYQGLQNELTTLVQARQKLEGQFTENESVQKEFAGLDDDAKIYKLVGPVLLKQETSEAKSTVDGRLEYIGKEIKRIEESITEIQGKSEGKRSEIMQIQAQAQQSAGKA